MFFKVGITLTGFTLKIIKITLIIGLIKTKLVMLLLVEFKLVELILQQNREEFN